jgi:hypothetical protein
MSYDIEGKEWSWRNGLRNNVWGTHLVAHAFNTSSQDAEAEGSQNGDQTELHSEAQFQTKKYLRIFQN